MYSFNDFLLRRATHDDARELYDICLDPDVMKYYGNPGFSLESAENAVAEIDWFNNLFNENGGRWIVCKKDDPRYAGDIGFFNYDKTHKRAELGYKLKKEYWGKGIISGFIKILLTHGFDECRYNRIEAMTDSRNIASKRVLEKCGFTLEGTFREYECENGLFIDMDMYAILKRDYDKQRDGAS